jgi:hypothetical protein
MSFIWRRFLPPAEKPGITLRPGFSLFEFQVNGRSQSHTRTRRQCQPQPVQTRSRVQ